MPFNILDIIINTDIWKKKKKELESSMSDFKKALNNNHSMQIITQRKMF